MKLELAKRHYGIYIAGNPGGGKSSLIQNLVIKEIKEGYGVAVIDPKGSLVDRILAHIPKSRADDTIYFDSSKPVPIDFFSYPNPEERADLLDMLLEIFALEDAPLSNPNLQAVLDTLFHANENPDIPDTDRCTFLDIGKFLTDRTRRETILNYCPSRREEWQWIEKVKPATEFKSILGRLRPYTIRGALNTVFSAKRPELNIADVITKNQILLVNLRDTKSAYFIGSLIATKFQQAIFARRDIPEAKRVPYYLYVDECHMVLKFSEETFETILTRAREFRLCLTLANQLPTDLPESIQRKLEIIHTKFLFLLKPKSARVFKEEIENATNRRQQRETAASDAHLRQVASKLNAVEHELAFVKERLKFGDAEDHVSPKKLDRLLFKRKHLWKTLGELNARKTREQLSYLDLLSLPEFTAVAINGTAVHKVRTPRYLGFSHASYAPYIKKRTLEKYAGQNRPKRDTDSSSPANKHEEPPELTKFVQPHPTKK